MASTSKCREFSVSDWSEDSDDSIKDPTFETSSDNGLSEASGKSIVFILVYFIFIFYTYIIWLEYDLLRYIKFLSGVWVSKP